MTDLTDVLGDDRPTDDDSTPEDRLARAIARGLANTPDRPAIDIDPPLELDDRDITFVDVAAILTGDWHPTAPELLTREDGHNLLYRKAVNAFVGEPSHGKSLLAQLAITQSVNAGGPVIVLDYEDVPDRFIRGRLLALGALPDRLTAGLFYVDQPGMLSRFQVDALTELITKHDIGLVVIDGVAEALTVTGLSEDNAQDYARWHSAVPRRLARAGAAVLLVDHVSKPQPKQPRGRYARGSGHKLSAIDGVSYMVQGGDAPTPTRAGIVTLTIAKDRHRGLGRMGDTVARVAFTPADEGVLEWTIQVPRFVNAHDTDDGPGGGPALSPVFLDAVEGAVRQCVAEHNMERKAKGPSTSRVKAQLRSSSTVPFDDKRVAPALLRLVRDSRLEHTQRPGGGDWWHPTAAQLDLKLGSEPPDPTNEDTLDPLDYDQEAY